MILREWARAALIGFLAFTLPILAVVGPHVVLPLMRGAAFVVYMAFWGWVAWIGTLTVECDDEEAVVEKSPVLE